MSEKEKETRIVRKIASEVRKWLVGTYTGRDYFRKDLAGFCAIASFHLFKALESANIDCAFVVNEWNSHAFVLWGENVVDITATQFSWERKYPPVLIQPVTTLGKTWTIGSKAKTEWDIKKLIWKWPKHQQPSIPS